MGNDKAYRQIEEEDRQYEQRDDRQRTYKWLPAGDVRIRNPTEHKDVKATGGASEQSELPFSIHYEIYCKSSATPR